MIATKAETRLLVWGALLLAGCWSTAALDRGDADVHGDTAADVRGDAGRDVAGDAPSDVVCPAPDDTNKDPRCPAGHQTACGVPCSTPGLACAYPGVGDGPDPQGCYATAMAWCQPPVGDAGAAPIWICAQ